MPRSLTPFGREAASPFSLADIGSVQREMERLFDDMVRGWPAVGGAMGNAPQIPRIDVRDTDKALEVRADLPGMEEKDIDIRLSDNRTLVIKAERQAEEDKSGNGWHIHERSHGSFMRSIPLPCEVNADKVSADYDQGVLTITLPKAPEEQQSARRIEIKKRKS